MLLAPGVDLRQPRAAPCLELVDVRQHRLEREPGVGDQLDVRLHVLPHLGLIDVDMDEGLDVRRELGELRRHAVVDSHADHHQNVGVLDRLQAPAGAHEAGHVQRERVLHRKRTDAEQGGANRSGRGHGQLLELPLGMTQEDAVAGEDHGSLGAGQRLGSLSRPLQVDVSVQLVARDLEVLRVDPLRVGHLHVLADVDQHRPGATGGRDVEGLVNDPRQLLDLRHQVAVLGHRARGADHV